MAQCNSKPYFRVVFLGFLLPLVSGDCSDLDLGMESGSIPDSNITASSTLNSGTPAKNGRLNFAGSSWCAATSDSNPYLQVDLQTLHFICAVSTQGNSQADEWVETYTLQTSTDGTTWTDYTSNPGHVEIFKGNNDRNTEEKNILYEGILTRWLRFVGKTKRSKFCMRTEVFGVKKYPVNLALKKPTDQSSTYNDEAHSENAVDGVRNTNWGAIGWCTHTRWENRAWWRVDLGSNHVPISDVFIINKIIGHPERNEHLKITLGDNSNVQSNPECVGRYSFRDFAASVVCYNNPLRTGRYVGIMHTRPQILNLCEVEVYSRENLACNKSTAQISDANSGVSSRAVDGSSNTTFSSGSCSQTGLASNPWWRVDLGRVEPVNQVYIVNRGDCCGDLLNSFEIRVGPPSNDEGVTNPICGGGFSVSQGEGASFFCRPSLFGQYVTIRSTKSGNVALSLCEVEVYSARRACEMQAVGLASRRLFPDSSFSASSSRNGNEAFKGRLNGDGVWSPSTDGNANDYLQINLQYEFFICAVATQGNPNADHWTKKYKLLLSLNETDWVTYQQEIGTDKVFNGSGGRSDIVKHNLTNSWRARFIRFVPTDYHSRKALRVEVYGVLKPTVPFQPPDNFTVTADSSTSITARWQLPPADTKNGIIRGFKLFYKKKGFAGSEKTEVLSGTTFTKTFTNLLKYTEYEFQVWAFSSAGDGPKSALLSNRTKEDVPSQAPNSFGVTVINSTSIRASWQLPPVDSRNGIIKGFKLFYKRKGSAGSASKELIKYKDGSTFTKTVTGLLGYTEYEFQMLAFTSVGDGTNSSVEAARTNEDAPSAPSFLNHMEIAPSAQHGPRVRLTWSRPVFENGIIRNYTLFYSHSEYIQSVHTETFGPDTFLYEVDVWAGETYQFSVRAVTIKPGANASISVDTLKYVPRTGPDDVSFTEVNETNFNISWAPLTRDKSYGKVKVYEVIIQGIASSVVRSKRSVATSKGFNTTKTFLVLSRLEKCSTYSISVRAYTAAGPGPPSQNLVLKTSVPGAPRELTINIGKTEGTLQWKEPSVRPNDVTVYKVNYTGTKKYDKAFSDIQSKNAGKLTQYRVKDLAPGTSYKFNVYATSNCGDSSPLSADKETEMADPLPPDVKKITEKSVSESSALIQLWPAKQRNGPISSYQVIVVKVVDGVKQLPDGYAKRLNSASVEKLNFYITAEIDNVPVYEASWEFTVGDEQPYKEYMNKKLENGQEYVVYQRAITRDNSGIFEGSVSEVATISVKGVGGDNEAQSSSSPVAAIAVPVVLVILLIPALVVAFLFYRRRKSAEKGRKDTSVHLDDIGHRLTETTESRDNLVYSNADEVKATAIADKTIYQNFEKDTSETSANQIYQNADDIHTTGKAANQIYQNSKVETTSGQDNQIYQNTGGKRPGKGSARPTSQITEPVYSEAEDGKPKAVPASKFANYFKSKTINGAAVLRDEFTNLPGGMLSPWEVAKKNKAKNRYGNIVSYDHSRVVLEPTEGDPSDYINASYIPTYDEESMCYIATQGPTSVTVSDFWRMIWQENCTIIVMLTNLVEQGKAKCHQYWPDSTSKFGAITVTLQKTETFADYVIRTLVAIKNSEKRKVVQFHYTTWPDRGVPHHSTALLAFRWKVHARHQLNQGPLVVHCSAGVGRTGTFIGIDAMLESAKEQGSVFIQKYLQAMRRQRPYMVQKEEQYLFLHQAVMEALVCGNTQVSTQDLMIRMTKLARVHKSSKKTGYAEEFKRLQLVSKSEDSEEESLAAFKPANIGKNRFPNIVPINGSRVLLRASESDKDYINASFVDGYTQRNTHILTQAPLDNTIEDFWRMALQYDVGTIVMLNNLEEGEESYPQYWPSAGAVTYGNVTLEILSETSSKKITTRRVSVSDAKPPKKKSTVQHLQFTGWNDPNSCPDPREIISLLTAVEKSQQQTGNGIIVFQCSDGVGRSGTLSAVMSLIERIKTEQTVDVFQTIKLIRVKRPGAVVTSEQYTFCYKTILAYLDSFKTYSNFADC